MKGYWQRDLCWWDSVVDSRANLLILHLVLTTRVKNSGFKTPEWIERIVIIGLTYKPTSCQITSHCKSFYSIVATLNKL